MSWDKLELLIRDVGAGLVSRENLFARLEEVSLGDVGEIIAEDLEDAVNHTPGFFLTREIDQELWRKQREYFVVICDLNLLGVAKKNGSEEFVKRRSKVIEQIDNGTLTDSNMIAVFISELK